MVSETTPPLPPKKLNRKGRPTHKYVGGPVVLNARMVRMVGLMIHGHPDDPSHTRYSIYDAATAVGYHRRAARALAMSQVFVDAYQRAAQGQSLADEIPSLERVREMIARWGGTKAGYIVRSITPAKAPPAATEPMP
jgi:hypothetical protein